MNFYIKNSWGPTKHQNRNWDIPKEILNLVWKGKLPIKINTSIWKLLHEYSYKLEAHWKGNSCILYLFFVQGPFHIYSLVARAVWFGSSPLIKTSELNQISLRMWLVDVLLRNKKLEQANLSYLQFIFTTLWTIWLNRNQVVHEGKCPNPMEIILTAQNLVCRYQPEFYNEKTNQKLPNPMVSSRLNDVFCGFFY